VVEVWRRVVEVTLERGGGGVERGATVEVWRGVVDATLEVWRGCGGAEGVLEVWRSRERVGWTTTAKCRGLEVWRRCDDGAEVWR
jgi:hypothetical protein